MGEGMEVAEQVGHVAAQRSLLHVFMLRSSVIMPNPLLCAAVDRCAPTHSVSLSPPSPAGHSKVPAQASEPDRLPIQRPGGYGLTSWPSGGGARMV